jgi:excisionase family DNA binding protein
VDRRRVTERSLEERMPTTVPELIDIETLSLCLGDSVRHVRRLVAKRRIPYLKVGYFIRFDPEEIVRWLDAACQPGRTDKSTQRLEPPSARGPRG